MDSSPLAWLPKELIKEICELVWKQDGPTVLISPPDSTKELAYLKREGYEPMPKYALAVTQTCRDLRAIASPIFFDQKATFLYHLKPSKDYLSAPLEPFVGDGDGDDDAARLAECDRIFEAEAGRVLKKLTSFREHAQHFTQRPLRVVIDARRLCIFRWAWRRKVYGAHVFGIVLRRIRALPSEDLALLDITIVLDIGFALWPERSCLLRMSLADDDSGVEGTLQSFYRLHVAGRHHVKFSF